jgi:hypothetical protein
MLLIGVEDSYAGAGVSFDLIRNSACLAKQLGYKYFVAELTSPISQHVWVKKLHFNIQK